MSRNQECRMKGIVIALEIEVALREQSASCSKTDCKTTSATINLVHSTCNHSTASCSAFFIYEMQSGCPSSLSYTAHCYYAGGAYLFNC
jgi:hypothetical protein